MNMKLSGGNLSIESHCWIKFESNFSTIEDNTSRNDCNISFFIFYSFTFKNRFVLLMMNL